MLNVLSSFNYFVSHLHTPQKLTNKQKKSSEICTATFKNILIFSIESQWPSACKQTEAMKSPDPYIISWTDMVAEGIQAICQTENVQ